MKQDDKIQNAQIDGDTLFLIFRQKVQGYIANILELESAVLIGMEDFSDFDSFCYAITAQKIYDAHYQIYCSDLESQFHILDYKLENNTLIRNPRQSFNLQSFINEQFYSVTNVFYCHISIINIQSGDGTFKADYIVSPHIGAHYGINLEFSCPDNACQLLSKKIVFILQGYGSNQLLGYLFPTIKIKDSYVIIPYTDELSESLVLAVYNLSNIQTIQSANLFIGAIQQSNPFYRTETLFEGYFYGQQFYLLTDAENQETLSLYKLNTSPQLVMNGQIKTSKGILKIKNNYSSDSVVLTINVSDDPKDGGSNHTVIWVILGILGGGMVVGAGIYYYRRKQIKVDTLI